MNDDKLNDAVRESEQTLRDAAREKERNEQRDEDRDARRSARRDAARARADEAVHERLLARRAREREEDVRNGRPQRGLFTNRGRRSESERERESRRERERSEDRGRSRPRDREDDGGLSAIFSRFTGSGRKEKGRPRTGAKRSVMHAIKQLPSYLRLLLGLISDGRVSRVDRFFVIAAAAYIISPVDFVPDIIPFFGEVDDVFLLMVSLQRLVNNAGQRVLLSHWRGDPDELNHLNFARVISAAGFFLPSRLKRRLFRMGGKKER